MATNPSELVWIVSAFLTFVMFDLWAVGTLHRKYVKNLELIIILLLLTSRWKHWFDIGDNWASTIDNLHNMARLEMYQTCGNSYATHEFVLILFFRAGAYNTPDMLTVGQGGMTEV